MHIKEAKFIISAVQVAQSPQDAVPEIALAGRSNVGKSSFINKLLQRNKLARTSGQPGKTQTLNFYSVNDDAFRLVDVPGYGYARVSKVSRNNWAKMNLSFLQNRTNLRLLILLMDIRHEPTKLDQEMYQFAESLDIPFAICLTKADKIKKSQLNKHLSLYKKSLNLPTTDALFTFSAVTGEGREEMLEMIETVLEAE
ncbi:ribosome biogenesis GTP-binding protein YihA/YsxC [Facklamia miroungae]|uniref:Probable GTP-binding protein EngB n=1 Tax=Facklamia miroungae TaxID=120956 RepID=A0A1G7PJY0_9LACT|nr:ribosome biogenesis GTP-binding protein YihA/YsxC [Facklamia miroungae]NKZ28740.1 YihA family ribosome biogenesis GTP-binding protein [Facklamia miroungae]SDF86541.1 GTP-binding protein [Facklamia miroungae]